jgi:hypothetical protein
MGAKVNEIHQHQPKISRRAVLVALAMAAALLASLALASASSAEPKGIFKIYSDCPTEKTSVKLCIFSETTSGEFAVGSTKIPINKPIVLQGGAVHTTGENFNEYDLVPPKDGNTMSKTELNVPGGLAGLINCEEIKGKGVIEVAERVLCKATFENKLTGVTSTTEPVPTTTNPIVLDLAALAEENGTALSLPVRAHLKNPLLGESCYIGSAEHPIQLHLTDGKTSPPEPNKPISGKLGNATSEVENGFESLVTTENTLVDNAFSVPVVEGCGGLASFLLDPIIDAKLGLESPKGHNTAILNSTVYEAESEAVLASEKF